MAGERAIVSGMTGRYASALFELARESNSLDVAAADLDRFEALLAAAPDLARLVRSPVFSAQEQLQALTAVLDRIGLSDLTARFLKVVTANRRLFAVPGMIKAYRALLASHRGELTAEVTFAEPPSAGQLSAVTEALTALTSKQVKVDVRTDPGMIGGLIVRLGSRMVDSSLRSRLNAIKHAMKGVS